MPTTDSGHGQPTADSRQRTADNGQPTTDSGSLLVLFTPSHNPQSCAVEWGATIRVAGKLPPTATLKIKKKGFIKRIYCICRWWRAWRCNGAHRLRGILFYLPAAMENTCDSSWKFCHCSEYGIPLCIGDFAWSVMYASTTQVGRSWWAPCLFLPRGQPAHQCWCSKRHPQARTQVLPFTCQFHIWRCVCLGAIAARM